MTENIFGRKKVDKVEKNHMMFLWQIVNWEFRLRSIEAIPETTAV